MCSFIEFECVLYYLRIKFIFHLLQSKPLKPLGHFLSKSIKNNKVNNVNKKINLIEPENVFYSEKMTEVYTTLLNSWPLVAAWWASAENKTPDTGSVLKCCSFLIHLFFLSTIEPCTHHKHHHHHHHHWNTVGQCLSCGLVRNRGMSRHHHFSRQLDQYWRWYSKNI